MKVKAMGLFLALAVLLTVAALPAAAASPAAQDAGVFSGQASVGKTAECNNDGSGKVEGAGIGFLPTPIKEASWRIDAEDSVLSLTRLAQGDLKLCGDLVPVEVAPAPPLGASCVTTHGENGQGTVSFPTDTVWISSLGWIATAGGTFLVTGEATTVKGKADGSNLTAVVQALDELVLANCLTKAGEGETKTGGATVFNVVAVYTLT